jgi:hypothetical protein
MKIGKLTGQFDKEVIFHCLNCILLQNKVYWQNIKTAQSPNTHRRRHVFILHFVVGRSSKHSWRGMQVVNHEKQTSHYYFLKDNCDYLFMQLKGLIHVILVSL